MNGGFKSPKYTLSEQESDKIWNSLEKSLPTQLPSSEPIRPRIIKYMAWAGAVAAAVVAGIFLFRGDSEDFNHYHDKGGVVAHTPFQPKMTDLEETTNQTSDERNGATLSPNAGSDSNASSKYNISSDTDSREEHSSQVNINEEIEELELELDNKVVESQKSDSNENLNKSEKPKEKKTKGKREFELGQSKRIASNEKFTLSASSNLSRRGSINNNSNNFIRSVATKVGYTSYSYAPAIEQVSKTTYSLPLNFALMLQYHITPRFSVASGVNYTFIRSKYDGLINGNPYRIKQGLHYVGIPLNFYYSVMNKNNFVFYVGAGATFEKGVRANYSMTTYTSPAFTQSASSSIKGMQYSVNVGMGVEYMFGPNNQFGIYLEPRGVYYFDSKVPASIRTDQPLQIDAQLGIRLHIK